MGPNCDIGLAGGTNGGVGAGVEAPEDLEEFLPPRPFFLLVVLGVGVRSSPMSRSSTSASFRDCMIL